MGNLLTRACRNIRSFSTMVFSLPSRPTDWFGRKGKSPEGRESGGPSTRRLLANQEFLSKLVGSARLNLWNGSRLPLNHIALRAAVFGVFLCITFVMPRWSQAQTCISALLLGKCRLGWAHQCGGSLRFDIFSDNLDASSTNSPPPKKKNFFWLHISWKICRYMLNDLCILPYRWSGASCRDSYKYDPSNEGYGAAHLAQTFLIGWPSSWI